MSIISEALKKAQADRSDETGSPLDAPQASKAVPIAVISVIAIAVIVSVIFATNRPSENSKTATSATETKKTAGETERSVKDIFVPKTYTLRDTPPENESTSALPKLSGIMYSPSHPMAVLDGITVREGETLHGITVQKIMSDRVKLSRNGEEFELRLK